MDVKNFEESARREEMVDSVTKTVSIAGAKLSALLTISNEPGKHISKGKQGYCKKVESKKAFT